jgi:hypothetical protein
VPSVRPVGGGTGNAHQRGQRSQRDLAASQSRQIRDDHEEMRASEAAREPLDLGMETSPLRRAVDEDDRRPPFA